MSGCKFSKQVRNSCEFIAKDWKKRSICTLLTTKEKGEVSTKYNQLTYIKKCPFYA